MREYEKKLSVTAEEYTYLWHRMIHSTVPVVVSRQVNYYYDTDDLAMNRRGITCRIREKGGMYIATVKEHGCGRAECSVETSQDLGSEYNDTVFTEKGLTLKGELVTQRMRLFIGHDIEAVIDKNSYLDTVDYEIEIEYEPKAEKRADKVMRELIDTLAACFGEITYADLIERQQGNKSKSARFFDRLTDMERGGEE